MTALPDTDSRLLAAHDALKEAEQQLETHRLTDTPIEYRHVAKLIEKLSDILTAAPVDHARAEREVIEAAQRFEALSMPYRREVSGVVEIHVVGEAWDNFTAALTRLTGKPEGDTGRDGGK